MQKQLCIIHANCQGDQLMALLSSTPSFNRLYTIKKYTNYLHEEINETDLSNCSLFLYQQLGEQWGQQATSTLLQKLPPKTQCLCIPNMFFNGYWPLWTNATHMAYGDILLEYLAKTNLKPAEIVHIYLYGDITKKFNINELVQISRNKEMEKEKQSCITTLNIIDTYWRDEQLFHTVNHPGPRLMLHMADSVLDTLGLGKVQSAMRKALYALNEEFIQPIHPQIGKYFQLPFATKNRQYNVYGQSMNFEQYVKAYVQCRMQQGTDRIDDFVVYLHLLARANQKICAA